MIGSLLWLLTCIRLRRTRTGARMRGVRDRRRGGIGLWLVLGRGRWWILMSW
jgi:hypothetical protein